MVARSSQKTRNTDELPLRPEPHFCMMRSVDVNGWVEDQWEHYVEEGSNIMVKDDIKELIE